MHNNRHRFSQLADDVAVSWRIPRGSRHRQGKSRKRNGANSSGGQSKAAAKARAAKQRRK
jgi:hypothetical protein